MKRILGIMLVLATISTFIAVGSCIWREYTLWKEGLSIEAIHAEGK